MALHPDIRRAQPQEAALVAEVLEAAAAALVRRGQKLWDAGDVCVAAIAGDVRAGMYYLARDESGPVGVFRFQLEDAVYWPEIARGTSAFVHRVAVHPRAQGRELAQVLLAHAVQLARAEGRSHLRLDCNSGRPRLRAVYERFGFRFHSHKHFGAAVADRFELALPPIGAA